MSQVLADGDAELKARHRTVWAWADYPRLASELIADLGSAVVAAANVTPGQRVLDVAAGSGNAAIAAARLGADVVATDLTPELLDAGSRAAQAEGLRLVWQVADAEALPFDDASFDAVISCVGVMFAPHHQAAADELVRTARPRGRISVLSWTPGGFVGEMLATMKPFAAPPPPGTEPAPLWGAPGHVAALLGDRAQVIEARIESLRVDAFESPEAFRDYFKAFYGPTIGVYRTIAHEPDRVASLDQQLAELARRHWAADGSMEWEYLLLTAVRT